MKRLKADSGFTLIEMAVVVIIAGMIMIPILQSYTIWQADKRYEVTRERISTLQTMITSYVASNNRYPCPANPILLPTDDNYGQEEREPDGSCTMAALAIGTCEPDSALSLCRVASRRFIPPTNPNPEPVLMGIVPIVTLAAAVQGDGIALSTSEAIDGWNNRFTYAVTESATVQGFNKNRGAVLVTTTNACVTITGRRICGGGTDTPDFQHYVLVSHGEEDTGAYTNRGVATSLCATGIFGEPGGPAPTGGSPAGSFTMTDIENCNMNGTFVKDLINKGDGPNHFDDIVAFGSTTTTNFWSYIVDNGGNITPNITNTNAGFVGIQTVDPQTALDVNGALRAETQVRSPEFCDLSGANCFRTQALTQNNSAAPAKADEGNNKVTGIRCSTGRAMVGISKGDEICDDVKIKKPGYQTCGVGEVLKSINTDGIISCEPI